MKMIIFKKNNNNNRSAIQKEERTVERIKQSFIIDTNLRRILSPISFVILFITISNVFELATVSSAKVLISTSDNNNNNVKSNDQITISQAEKQHQRSQKAASALEEELNSIVKQAHEDGSIEANNRQLAETIISRLMVDNLTGSNLLNNNDNNNNVILNEDGELIDQQQQQADTENQQQKAGELIGDSYSNNNNNNNEPSSLIVPNVYEALKLKKLLSMIQQYYEDQNNANIVAGGELPLLPNGEIATMKRATARLGNYLHNQQRQTNGYPRNNFDFGLGKRPDGNVLRFGDSLNGLGTNSAGSGFIQPLSQFGKRPSSHRYDFGLGKRVASPTYPRYDFGLGKRAPSRIRYDFGLGK